MSASEAIGKYGLTCLSGGKFYICSDTRARFIGCCSTDPCTTTLDGDCPEDELFEGAFSKSSYEEFPPQSCIEPYDELSWYTCQNADPPFIGCCKNNPCDEGCQPGNLVPARLGDNDTNTSQLLPPRESTTTNSAPTISSPMPNPSPTAQISETGVGNTGTPIGVIVGASVGGVVALLLFIGWYLWWRKRNERKEEEARHNLDAGRSDQPEMRSPLMVSPMAKGSNSQASPMTPEALFASRHVSNQTMSAPRSSGILEDDMHNRHSSHISELSGDDWRQHATDFQPCRSDASGQPKTSPIPELDGSGVSANQPSRENRESDTHHQNARDRG